MKLSNRGLRILTLIVAIIIFILQWNGIINEILGMFMVGWCFGLIFESLKTDSL